MLLFTEEPLPVGLFYVNILFLGLLPPFSVCVYCHRSLFRAPKALSKLPVKLTESTGCGASAPMFESHLHPTSVYGLGQCFPLHCLTFFWTVRIVVVPSVWTSPHFLTDVCSQNGASNKHCTHCPAWPADKGYMLCVKRIPPHSQGPHDYKNCFSVVPLALFITHCLFIFFHSIPLRQRNLCLILLLKYEGRTSL